MQKQVTEAQQEYNRIFRRILSANNHKLRCPRCSRFIQGLNSINDMLDYQHATYETPETGLRAYCRNCKIWVTPSGYELPGGTPRLTINAPGVTLVKRLASSTAFWFFIFCCVAAIGAVVEHWLGDIK